MIAKRMIAYLIDYLSVSILLMIVCMMIGTLPGLKTTGDYPFLVIAFVYMPHIFLEQYYFAPGSSWRTGMVVRCYRCVHFFGKHYLFYGRMVCEMYPGQKNNEAHSETKQKTTQHIFAVICSKQL